MEFLDPEDKRKRTTRLFIGYGLVAILIGLATTLLIYLAQGYNYDADSGVVQNGLVFVENKPVSADIYIDGQQKAKTGAKLTLSEGTHSLVLKQAKYRDWSKSFNLEGGSVLYFLYPKLFPVDIKVSTTEVFNGQPVWASQSLNRQLLLLQQNANAPVLTIIDLSNPTSEPQLSTLPSNQIENTPGQYGVFTPLEWSDDNQHLLLKQVAADGVVAYIIFDVGNADQTINLTDKLKLGKDDIVSLRDEKSDKYYIHNLVSGDLKIADLKNGVSADFVLKGVVSFKSYADSLILYTTYSGAKTAEADVYVMNNRVDKYKLKSLSRDAGNKYLLDVAQFSNNWYYVAASNSGKTVQIFRNPLSRTKPGNKQVLNPQMSLMLNNPQFVSFSSNARFITMQSGKQFVVYDGEQNRVFKYESSLPIAATQEAEWMDGHRLWVVTDGKINVFEFDGTNLTTIGTSRPEFGAYFDKDYKYVYSLVLQADSKTGFQSGQLTAN